MTAEQALAVLQEELAFQGETVARLNDALAGQQQDILLLRRQLELLSSELRSLRTVQANPGSESAHAAADDKPPHY